MRRLVALLVAVPLLAACGSGRSGGSFTSSDPLLNQIWRESAHTAALMLSKPVRLGGACQFPAGHTIILDGVVRDRCEFIGDLAVTGKTLLVSRTGVSGDIAFALEQFAHLQRPDGSLIPLTAPTDQSTLADYQAYFVDVLHTYLLYTGDLETGRTVYRTVVRILDRYYTSHTNNGLFVNDRMSADYAGPNRRSFTVAYYNAVYVYALKEAAEIARWLGHPADATAWLRRANSVAMRTDATFWDPRVDAYKDTPNAPIVHPQDGNAFAVLAGIGSHKREVEALDYLARANTRPYGNTMADTDVWSDPKLFGTLVNQRVYPFISYFEVLARFRAGLAGSALDLIRREWGYMVKNGPGTTWETIGPYGSGPVNHSWAHGWSSGAAPALTEYVLGVRPTSPGFKTFVVDPHAGGMLTWARGAVPTPKGPIRVSWQLDFGDHYTISVHAPNGEQYQRTTVSGKTASPSKRSSR